MSLKGTALVRSHVIKKKKNLYCTFTLRLICGLGHKGDNGPRIKVLSLNQWLSQRIIPNTFKIHLGGWFKDSSDP